MLNRFLCWMRHDFVMDGHIRTACETPNGDATFLYERKCSRDGCGVHQEISIMSLKGIGRFNYLEREWIE